MRHARCFGITLHEPEIDFAAVNWHVRDVMARIEPNDSVERYRSFGVSPGFVEVEGRTIRARRFVLATGSRAVVPPILGLDPVSLFTHEMLFDNQKLPEHPNGVGGGPIGSEMVQAHRRLGSRVTVLDIDPLQPHDDPELTAVVKESLTDDGIEIVELLAVRDAPGEAGGITVSCDRNGEALVLEGSHLLVAVGRRSDTTDLGLDAAAIAPDRNGIRVDRRLRTTNRRVFAIGDKCRSVPVHPSGRASRGNRHQECPVAPSGEGESRRLPVGDLHGPGIGPCRPDGRRSTQAARNCHRL